jgi:hypothetical protein
MRLRGHDEIILVGAIDHVSPPIEIQIASIPKSFVCRLPIKRLIVRNHKHLVDHPSINLEIATNHKTQSLLLAG